MWLSDLIMIAGLLVAAYSIAKYVVQDELRQNRVTSLSHHPNHNQQEVLTYCLKESIFEAFQVGSDTIPEWAMRDDIDVILSRPPRVVLHGKEGNTFTAKQDDWIVRMSNGSICCLSDQAMQSWYVKIRIED